MKNTSLIKLCFLSIFLCCFGVANAQFEFMHREIDPEIKKIQYQILNDKFDQVLPQIMREKKVDMWIHIVRYGDLDPLATLFGSDEGIYVFTDREGDRIERAFFGFNTNQVKESGAFDILVAPDIKVPLKTYPDFRVELNSFYQTGGREWPGRDRTELDFRFDKLDEFVTERDPRTIAINYLDELGSAIFYEFPRLRPDGISHTDYNYLVKKLGDKYAKRFISAEYMEVNYLLRPVESELKLYSKIRSDLDKKYEELLSNIVKGETKVYEVGEETSALDENGNRLRRDHIITGGELLIMVDGHQSGGFFMPEWKYGNYHECVDMYAYVLKDGEIEASAPIKRFWEEANKIRSLIEKTLKVGLTAGENYENVKKALNEAGILSNDVQSFDNSKDYGKTKVSVDMHAAGSGLYAPRIGPLGPDWQRDIVLPMNHHFYFEFFMNTPTPEWGEDKTMTRRFHDGAIITEKGVAYLFPYPKELTLIK